VRQAHGGGPDCAVRWRGCQSDMTRIQLSDGSTLTINDGKVTAATPRLSKVINYMVQQFEYYQSPAAWDHDLYIAEELIKEVGGTIVHHDPVPPPPDHIIL
jgi:hypothetical protein